MISKIRFKFSKRIFAIILGIVAFLSFFSGRFIPPAPFAFASGETEYSDVLDDLEKTNNFSKNNFPAVSDDYSLNVITIAESNLHELFVYVYQPSGQATNLCASFINISNTINSENTFIDPHNYNLRLLNSSGVFYKYVVEDFDVSYSETRYYEIYSIFRPFNESLGDVQADNDNTISYVSYEVAKQYCFSTVNGETQIKVLDVETIEITDKFVGFVRYESGFHLWAGSCCDSHFVAFDTDKPMDKLLSATLFFDYKKYDSRIETFSNKFSITKEVKNNEVYLDHTQRVSVTVSSIFGGNTYDWERVSTVSEFVKDLTSWNTVYKGLIVDKKAHHVFNETEKTALQGKQWVLRFYESSYSYYTFSNEYTSTTEESGTIVENVSILRLEFETNGVEYNLGVVDNMQTGSSTPFGKQESKWSLTWLGKLLLALLGLLLLGYLLNLVGLLVPLLNILLWLILLPFKLIKKIIDSSKKRKQENQEKNNPTKTKKQANRKYNSRSAKNYKKRKRKK